MEEKLTEAERLEQLSRAAATVKRYAYGSAFAGVLPIPMVDVALLGAIQLKMIAALAKIFDTEFRESAAKGLISSFVGLAAASTVSVPVASSIKAVPGIGAIAGAVTVAGLGSATTFAIGKVFIEHFASGGTILTLDPEEVRDYYEEQFEDAKKTNASERGMP